MDASLAGVAAIAKMRPDEWNARNVVGGRAIAGLMSPDVEVIDRRELKLSLEVGPSRATRAGVQSVVTGCRSERLQCAEYHKAVTSHL